MNFVDVSLGCGNIIQLASVKVPSFSFPNSIIVLDGDVKEDARQFNRTKKLKNVLFLPTNLSIEQLLSEFLFNLSDTHPLWNEIDETFDHQYCFQEYSNDEIQTDREKAKKWFNTHYPIWGRNASKVLNVWKKENKDLVQEFNDNFVELINRINK